MLIKHEKESEFSPVRISWISITWIALSCFLGYILSLYIDPPDVIWLMYLEYTDFIYYYDLFCLAMMSSFSLMPFALFFYWKDLWCSFKVISNPSKSSIFVLSMLTPITLLPSFGFLFLSDEKGSVFHIFLNLLTFLFDWMGGVVFNFFCFITFFWLITIVAKLIKELKNERKNHY